MLSTEDRLRGAVIEALMCQGHVDLASLAQAHGQDVRVFDSATAQLQEFRADGLIEWEGSTITATPLGLPVIRVIAAAYDAYLATGKAKHAVAV